jgi:hypothetical protein
MSNQATIVSNTELNEVKKSELTLPLDIIIQERVPLIEKYDKVIILELTKENVPRFKSLRLKISDNRTKRINVWHRTAKEYFLAGGKFVDAIKNKEIAINKEMEAKLLEAETFIENAEIKRLAELQAERVALIRDYIEDAEQRIFSDMDQDVWEPFLASKKAKFYEVIKEKEKAEIERQIALEEEKAEIERINLENAKLLEEANQRAKIAEEKAAAQFAAQAELDAKRAADQKVIDDKRIAAEKVIETKRAAAQKIIDNEIIAERAESLKIKEELELKKQQELDLIESNKVAAQNELKKDDLAKVVDLISTLKGVKNQFTFESESCVKMYKDVGILLDRVVTFIEK